MAHIIYFPIICRGCDRPIHEGSYCWQCQEWIDRVEPQPSVTGYFVTALVSLTLFAATVVYVGSLVIVP